MKRDRPASRDSGSRPEETVEAWEDRVLRGIFRITFDESQTRNAHGSQLYPAPGLLQELKESTAPARLTTAVLDQALLEVASALGKATPLDYLLGCWKRVCRQFAATKKAQSGDQKLEVMTEARRLCFSYCVFAATIPDMFS